MKPDSNLYSVLYEFLEARILFGIYREGDYLPTLRQLANMFYVSPRTVTSALKQLEQKQYIQMPAASRPIVTVSITREQQEKYFWECIRTRHNALADLRESLRVFFPKLLVEGLMRCEEADWDCLSQYIQQIRPDNLTVISDYIIHILKKLGNPMLLRIYFTSILFAYPLLFSVRSQTKFPEYDLDRFRERLSRIIFCCRRKDYQTCQEILRWVFYDSSQPFYERYLSGPHSVPQTPFIWPIHKERPQVRATIVATIIGRIFTGMYPSGSFLPSTTALEREFTTSTNSVRRSIDSLTAMGVVKNVSGKGIQVTSFGEMQSAPDYDDDEIRKNLFYYLKIMQILLITGKQVIQDAAACLTESDLEHFSALFQYASAKYNLFFLHGVCLDMVIHYHPYMAIRQIYMRLAKLWIWGSVLWHTRLESELKNDYVDGFLSCLREKDAPRFASLFDSLTYYLFCESKETMLQLGVPDTGKIVTPFHESEPITP